jgi:phage shock protein C
MSNARQFQQPTQTEGLVEPLAINGQTQLDPQGSILPQREAPIHVEESIKVEASIKEASIKEERTMQEESVPVQSVRTETEQENRIPASQSVRTPLYRHPTHQILGGVCGGLAEYLNIDPVLVRLLWVVMSIPTAGAGILAYIVLWLLLPVGTANGGQRQPAAINISESSLRRAGSVLVIIGGLWFLANVGVLPWIWNAFWSVASIVFWPALLIGAGLLLLKNQKEWRVNFQDWRSRARMSMPKVSNNLRVDRGTIKSGLNDARQRIPLKRSRTDRMWLGVSGGMAESLRLDANLLRLFWILFSLGTMGFGVLLYAILGAVLPVRNSSVAAINYQAGYQENGEAEAKQVQIIDASVK